MDAASWMRSRAIIRKLNHPRFVKTFSSGTHEGRPYVVNELLEAPWNLKGLILERGAQSAWKVLDFASQLAEAIAFAHDQGIVIGGLSPMGIIAMPNDSLVIVDVGVHHYKNDKPHFTNWLNGYKPPEGVKNEPITPQADFWALGTILFELATGQPLLDALPKDRVLRILRSTKPIDLAALKERAPSYVLRIVERCLQKQPADRYASAAELQYDIEEAQFEELVRLDDYGIMRLAMDFDAEQLAVALVDAGDAMTTHVLANLDAKVATAVRRDLAKPPTTADAKHAARCAIVQRAARLIAERRLALPG